MSNQPLAFCYVAASIAHLVAFEVCNLIEALGRLRPIPNFRHRAFIAMLWMETIVHMAAEVGRAVKPWAGADEDSAHKPFWAVIAVGSAGIWRDVIVTVGTNRSDSNVDGDLSL